MAYTFPTKLAGAFLLLLSQARAAPLEQRCTFTKSWRTCQEMIVTKKDETTAIDSTTFSNLQLFEQYAAASYCPGNNNVTYGGNKLTCPTHNCPLVEANNVTTVYEFQK